MQTKEYTFMNRTGWPSGPWDGEPDKVQWPDPDTGLPCLAVRNLFGNWCGYVGIPNGHTFFEVDRHDIPGIYVHGGLNFAGPCDLDEGEHGLCHVPDPGEPDQVWWLGFDCGHAKDVQPQMFVDAHGIMEILIERFGARYRTLEYVKMNCALLAAQLVGVSQHG